MTLDGTNTWVLHEPGSGVALVLDPGPDDPAHLARVEATVGGLDARLAGVLITHGHADHSAGAARLAGRHGVGVRALDPRLQLGEEGLAGGDVVTCGDLELRVLATPGHSGDSLSLLLVADGGLLTGDTLLGRGTTVVAHPDGRLADYLESLRHLRETALESAARHVLTGHGPALADPVGVIDAYLAHRRARLDQVREALRQGAGAADDPVAAVVASVYADVPRSLWPAAALSVRAQLEYLRDQGEA
jgi:glyoxylase-like metal-dependent hydrolase (beta-lactamase superfamily II)